jgi:5-formyltetrahydrofolate cyclo-ligase
LGEGAFKAMIPEEGAWLEPEVMIVPLLAWDRRGYRLGYGGGFYDRTLEGLRARGPVMAVGFAFAAQEVDAVPVDEFDQRLDAVVTEKGVTIFGA